VSGTLGALLGDEVVTAGRGTWVFKCYGLDIDPTTVPGPCERFGLHHPLADA
jgi:hypothetical protein